MRKTLAALLAAATLGVAALPSSAEARWGWGWGGFGVGLATGAIVGGALAAGAYNPCYGYGYGYGLSGLLSGLCSGLLRLLRRPAILRLLSVLASWLVLVTERRADRSGSLKRRLAASPARRTPLKNLAKPSLANCRAVR
jgi:hypothetical protein